MDQLQKLQPICDEVISSNGSIKIPLMIPLKILLMGKNVHYRNISESRTQIQEAKRAKRKINVYIPRYILFKSQKIKV